MPGELADLRHVYADDLDAGERGIFTAWLAFTATFLGVRTITHAIKDGRGPFHDVSVGGAHLHHYMWGLAGLSAIGATAVAGKQKAIEHPAVATAYGASMALIVDEFALLLELKDVYWQKQGRLSVDVATGIIGGVGSLFSALPLVRHYRRRRAGRG